MSFQSWKVLGKKQEYVLERENSVKPCCTREANGRRLYGWERQAGMEIAPNDEQLGTCNLVQLG